MPTRPKLIVQPNVITKLEETIWLTFIYSNGPQNSMAMLKWDTASIGGYQITNLPANMGISVGSGYKHQVRLIFFGQSTYDPSNNVYVLKIPYTYTIPGTMKDFEDTLSIALDFRQNKNRIPHVQSTNELVTRSTKIHENCTPNLLNQCKNLFKRIDSCSDAWVQNLNSHVPSMQAFMQAILFKRQCANAGVQQEDIGELLRCIISANIGLCQIENRINDAMLKCTQKSPSLYVQTNLFNTLAKSLNLPRFDLCRVFNNFYRLLFYLNKLIPPNVSLQNGDTFNKFLTTVANVSDRGEFITLTESIIIQNSTDDFLFVTNWNRLYEELNEQRNIEKSSKLSVIELLSAFLDTTEELNKLSKQITNTNPPALMNDLITSLLKTSEEQSNVVMIANINVEPRCLRESSEFQVSLQLQNPIVNTTVEKLEMRIRFQGTDPSRVNYKLKPVLYNGQISDADYQILRPGQNLTVQWKVTSTFDFRLTRNLIQTATVGLSFQVKGKRGWQEAKSNSFQIGSAEMLRTLVLLYPNITNKMNASPNPFSARISVLNVGYSTIKDVRLIQIRPDMSNSELNGPLEFSLDSVHVDSNQFANTLNLDLGTMKSAESRQIYLNFSTPAQEGFFRNLSFVCTSNDRLLDGYSSRQFYIRRQIRSESFLISELSDIYQLYHYQADQSKLTSLNSVFFTQESSLQTSNCYSSIVQAFQLADENKKFDSPLIGNSQWPRAINYSAQLVAIFQVFPNFDVMQRVVRHENIWLSYESEGQKEVNFIDLRPFTSASKIYYELVFAHNECKSDLSFLQKDYHIPYPAEALSKYSIVSQIQAIAPKVSYSHPVAYKLLSQEPNLPFAILAENAAIIFMNSTSIDDRPHCAILVAEDINGRIANASIQLGGRRQINCSRENEEHTLFQHVLGGAHNLPFDYNEARAEFLNNSLSDHSTVPPIETTTEMPGDEWTEDIEEVELSTIFPQSTLKLITTTSTESIIVPDSTLTSIQLSTTLLVSIGPDNYLSTTDQPKLQVSPEQPLPTTTNNNIQVADILPIDSITTIKPEQTTKNEDILIDLLTISTKSLPTTTPLPIFTGAAINKNTTFNTKTQMDNRVTSAEMVDMACKTKNQKPMMQVLCDLAKSVYKTHA